MYDVVIIGAGPAGLTSALYASRAGLKTLIIEKGAPGGKVFLTHLVENYPGYESITGRELAKNMHAHALKFGAEYVYGDVEEVIDGTIKIIKTNMSQYEAKTIIIATGTENRQLGVLGEKEFAGRGVSYCAVCDGNFFKEQDVVVIGGGNSALEEALYLADICKSVTIIHRSETFRAESYVIKNIENKKNINLELNSVIDEIIGEDKVQSVRINNLKTKTTKIFDTNGVFIYIGLIPLTSNFKPLNILNEYGNIDVDENMRTKQKGLYGAGDVNNKNLRQIVTAINDGAIAAQSIINDLK